MNVPQDISSSEHVFSPIFHSNLLSIVYIFHVSTEESSRPLDGVCCGCDLRLMCLLGASQLDQCLPLQPLNSHQQKISSPRCELKLELVALSSEALTLVFGRRKFLSRTMPTFGVRFTSQTARFFVLFGNLPERQCKECSVITPKMMDIHQCPLMSSLPRVHQPFMVFPKENIIKLS